MKDSIAFILFLNYFISFSQVGIGTTNPGSTLDVVNTSATGNTIEATHSNGANASSALWLKNSGIGKTINAQILNALNTSPVIEISQLGTGYGLLNNISFNGGTGEYINLEAQGGIGVYIQGVDNVTAPTTGGDVFGFSADVYTQTPTGALINGAILSGTQHGVGQGLVINHSGISGINAEFSTTNGANSNSVIRAITLGQGSAIVAQNQNNVITGTVSVGDFSYTGSDVTDHRGIYGFSRPAAGWGIGVLGNGGWYGMFSNGNSGATGVKSFIIDHPEDPAHKILRHFSIESNEVLNIYRGTAVFNTNGSVVINLPEYYHSINRNASYQLTPIGTSMPNIFIEKEIENSKFKISGGIPNKKVSWVVTAERNDPYLQQQPRNRNVIIEKTGSRKGKYLTPELYNQPKEKGMFYNKNTRNLKPHKIKKISATNKSSKSTIEGN